MSQPNNPFDLPKERLATTDEDGQRVYLYPEDVRGKWKNRRTLVYIALIFFFMILPWIHFKGDQIILLDISARHFIFFGQHFYGHDAPFLFFLMLGFVVLIGFATALWGRVWCGWACPQTVFIQALYSRIERLVEGGARRRQKRDLAPMNMDKFWRKMIKWTLFFLVSAHLSHSILGFFVGTRELLAISFQSPLDNLGLFISMLFLTFLFLFDFGWFREQFCIIACPYGRFQSVMMDEHSLVIAYDNQRGEPRRAKGVSREEEGDCVSCSLCVRACPTGIDIRRAPGQLECIACTQCIDACDEVMMKVGRPSGLIRYTTEKEMKGDKISWMRPRTLIYFIILLGLGVAFFVSLDHRQDTKISFLRATGNPYQLQEQSGEVLNRFEMKIDQARDQELRIILEVESEMQNDVKIVISRKPYIVDKEHATVGMFFRFHQTVLEQGSKRVQVHIYHQPENGDSILLETKEINLVGPFGQFD